MFLSWLRQPSQRKSKAALRLPIRLQLESLEERIALSGGISIEPSSLPPATVGTAYFQPIHIAGGATITQVKVNGTAMGEGAYVQVG